MKKGEREREREANRERKKRIRSRRKEVKIHEKIILRVMLLKVLGSFFLKEKI